MIIETNEFKCPNCNYHLYKHNKVVEKLDGYSSDEQVINCERCNAKYLLNGNDVTTWFKGIERNTKTVSQNSDRVPIVTYLILGLFLFGGFCLVMDYFSRGNDSVVANKISQVNPSNKDEVTTQNVVSYEPSNSAELSNENLSKSQLNQNSKTYYGKYTQGEDKRWYSDNFSMTVNNGQVTYLKDGNKKYFDVIDEGIYTRKEQQGITFSYQKYFLTTEKIYMLISHKKEVRRKGTFYYRIIIDGQTQLAL